MAADLGPPAEELARALDEAHVVGASPWDRGLRSRASGVPRRALDDRDQVANARALAAAQVDEVRDPGPDALGREDDAAGNVVYVGEVARDRAVAIEGDGLPREGRLDEAPDAHVGTAARPVDGEEAERDRSHAVDLDVARDQELAGALRRRVGRERARARGFFAEGERRVAPVDARGRAEDEPREPGRAHASRRLIVAMTFMS